MEIWGDTGDAKWKEKFCREFRDGKSPYLRCHMREEGRQKFFWIIMCGK